MAVIGYASATSVRPGGSIAFHVSSDTPGPASLVAARVGSIAVSATVSANLTTLPTPANAWEGFG